METIQLKDRQYDVIWSEDTLLPENIRYVSDLQAWAETPKGRCEVTSERILNAITDKVQADYAGRA